MSAAHALDQRHQIGANGPPHLIAFEAHRVNIEDLYTEAKNFCDGEPIDSEGQANAVSLLMDELRKASKAADDARVAEKKPLDEQIKEIQDRWNPLIQKDRGKVDLAISACKAALAPWLRKLDDEKRAAAEAARLEAERIAAEAAAASRAAQPDDLEAREKAEALVANAQKAQAVANRAASDRAQATGGARATTLRSYWEPVLVDAPAALKHYVSTRPDDLKAALLRLAEEDVRAGKRTIPGFDVREDRRVV